MGPPSAPDTPGRAGYNGPMVADRPDSPAERLRLAFDLFAAGESLMRARLRRDNPDISQAELEALVFAWLLERPGAESGDVEGRSVPWPRPAA